MMLSRNKPLQQRAPLLRSSRGGKSALQLKLTKKTLLVILSILLVFFFYIEQRVLLDIVYPPDKGLNLPERTQPPELCFISCVYAPTLSEVKESVTNVAPFVRNYPSISFYLFTNLPDLPMAPGWTRKIVTQLPYRRLITHSRYGKFMAWKESGIDQCQTIVYLDGNLELVSTDISLWRTVAWALHHAPNSPGLMEYPHHQHRKGPLHELELIQKYKKDLPEHVQASVEWLKAQPDFNETSTIYSNQAFFYDPHNPTFQQIATSFWNHYSQEVDSWRDQPLWSYMVHHHQAQPISFPVPKHELFRKQPEWWFGLSRHKYSKDNDADATAVQAIRGGGVKAQS